MDFISHTLWGYSLFGFRGKPGVAIASGAFPDVISFGPLVAANVLSGNGHHGAPSLSSIPVWAFTAYDASHSLLSASFVIAIVAKYHKGVAWAMLAWPVHIFLDIPFHTKAYFPTKFLWPFTDFSIDGISWGDPRIWFTQLGLLAAVFFYRFWHRNTQKQKGKSES